MQRVYKLLLSLAAASAVVRAENGMRYTPDIIGRDEPCAQEIESKESTDIMAMLNERLQHSREFLHSLLYPTQVDPTLVDDANRYNEADDAVRFVEMEQQEKEDPALERKTACLKAVEVIHEQEQLQQQMVTLMSYIRSTFNTVLLLVWGGPSCNELDRPELVDQCKLVLKSEDVVQKFLQDGKTDDQVCDIMSAVSDLDTSNNFSCHLCQRLVQMIGQTLSQEVQHAQHVQEIVGTLCMSPGSTCHTFPKNYDAIVDWMKRGTESDAVCSRLAMC